MVIVYKITQTDQELKEIIELQTANRPEHLSPQELQSEGFVTVRHDIETLRKMQEVYPHVIAKNADQVIGYALCMMKSSESLIPAFSGVFDIIESIHYQGMPLTNNPLSQDARQDAFHYFVMGQVCIHKDFRGKGVFAGLYQQMRDTMASHFEGIVTAISPRNPRSLRAHAKVGFHAIHQFTSSGEDWKLVMWDWSKK